MNEVASLIDVFFVIALIVPGFLAWQCARFVCNEVERERKKEGKKEEFSSFAVTIYSLVFTVPIIATFSLVTGIQSIEALRTNLFNPLYLGILLFLGGGYGTLFGSLVFLYDKNREPEKEPKEKYDVEEAKNLTEARQLIAEGYEYAADFDGKKLFRKPKRFVSF